MSEYLHMLAAWLLFLSPLPAAGLCAGAQILLARKHLALLAVLPAASAILLCLYPLDQNWLFQLFYMLDAVAAFAGSVAGAFVGWLMEREHKRPRRRESDDDWARRREWDD